MSNLYFNLGAPPPEDQWSKFEFSIQKELDQTKKDHFLKLDIDEKIAAYLFAFMHLELEALSDEIELYTTIFIADSALQYMKNLRALFRSLREEDLSKDIHYALNLSKSWHGITSYQDTASSKELKSEAHIKIAKLIDLFYCYPSKDEHAIGFYLEKYAGENWLPFPFIKILGDLHEEYIDKKERSILSQIIKLISNIIDSFGASQKKEGRF